MILHDAQMTLGAIRDTGEVRVLRVRLSTDREPLSRFTVNNCSITRDWKWESQSGRREVWVDWGYIQRGDAANTEAFVRQL